MPIILNNFRVAQCPRCKSHVARWGKADKWLRYCEACDRNTLTDLMWRPLLQARAEDVPALIDVMLGTERYADGSRCGVVIGEPVQTG